MLEKGQGWDLDHALQKIQVLARVISGASMSSTNVLHLY